ncbi:MAG: type II secretion system protein GspN [Myxococcota bacterium]
MKKFLYVVFFGFAFIVSLYLTFPIDALRPYIEKQMQEALAGDPSHPLVLAPSVHIGELSLWRLSGVSVSNLRVQMGSETTEPGQTMEVQKLKFRFGIFSTFLSKMPKVQFDATIYDGRARGSVRMTDKGNLSDLWLDINQIDLQKLRGETPEGGLPLAGVVNLNADISLGKNPAKDGSGTLSLDFSNLSVGPGLFEIPGAGGAGLTLPLVKLGRFSGNASFQKGKATIQNLKLVGGDLEADVNASLELSENILFSPLKGAGWFKMKEDFKKKNPKMATLLELNPDMKAAEDADGKVYFTLFGSLVAPTPKWGKQP